MTSSGSGPYRVGGLGSLSSSSNLSPLAPPFRVERSLQKQNSTNTCVNYPDVLMYGPYYESAGQLWNNSSSSATGSTFAPTVGVSVTCSSSPTVYGYSGSQSSSTVSGVYDPFSYDPFPNSMCAVSEDVKSYYPPYVSTPAQKDGFLSLGVNSGDRYDLLSNSASTHLRRSGDEDRKLDWGSVWSGVNEQSKWSEYAQVVGSKDSSLFDSQNSKSPLLVDEGNKSRPSTDVYTHSFADGRSKTNVSNGDCSLDEFLWKAGVVQENRSLLGGSRLQTSDSSLVPKESSHHQGPVAESASKFHGFKNATGLSLGDHFSQSGAYVFGSASTASTFPVTKNKALYVESSSLDGIFSAPKLNPDASFVGKESNISAGYNYSYQVEPRIPLGLKRQSSVVIRRPPSSSAGPSSSQVRESLDTMIGIKNGAEKSQDSPQMPHHFSSAGQDVEVNDTQSAYSVEKMCEVTDVHNPAEDSPCWRGASSSYFSPFAVSKGMLPDVRVKKLDECTSMGTQTHQLSFRVDTYGCGDLFSEKCSEGKFPERPFNSECASKGNEESLFKTRQPLCFDLNAQDGLQFADESYVSTKECCILNKSETDALPEITLPAIQVSEGGDRPECPPGVVNNSLNVLSSSENNHASSPLGNYATLNNCQVTSKISESNIDVNVLLKTLLNLSEMLRCYCFSKRGSVPEEHSIAIKQVIANLNASMSLMAGEKPSTMSSLEINSCNQELPVAQMVNDAAFEAVAAAVKVGITTEGLLDSVSCKDDPNSVKDFDMMEAIKNVLHENFRGEEEMDQRRLLYKNLWLDAEASLCAMTAKARFLRVKADMEKPQDGAKDKEISSTSNVPADVHETIDLASKVETLHNPNSQAVDGNTVEFREPIATNEKTLHGDDVDASVMARYQILKSRIQSAEAPSQENKESFEGHMNPSKFYDTGLETSGIVTSDYVAGLNIPVLAKYPFPKSRVAHDSLNNEYNTSPGEYNYLPDRDSSSPMYQTLECGVDSSDSFPDWVSKSVGDLEEGEASVMARFRIIQSRIQDSDSVDTGQVPVSHDDLGSSEQQMPTLRGAFGPYPNFTEEENEDPIGIHVNGETFLTQLGKTNRLNSEIFESWYGNDCPSSDWEHVSKEDVRKTN
ncbi:hypothetical protein KSS87_023666 [Heliosperma pusillum]|nr:hypothetical protein KSS87_023666 [Heliosperma pusillum]